MWLFGQVVFSWDHGIAIGVLTALFGVVGWVSKRVFGENGTLDQWVEKQGRFFDGLLERIDSQLAMCRSNGASLVRLNEEFDSCEDFKTVETNKSLADMARVELLKLHSREGLDDEEREKIVKILSAVVERLDPKE